jgi:hypothetical protein
MKGPQQQVVEIQSHSDSLPIREKPAEERLFRKVGITGTRGEKEVAGNPGVGFAYPIDNPHFIGEHGGTTEEHTSCTEDVPDLYRCPKCGGPMKVIERLTAAEIQLRSPPRISSAA